MSSGFDYSVLKEGKIYDTLRPLGKLITKSLYKIEYVGTENIPADGGIILASNHIHAIDPLIIAMGMEKRQLHFMAKKELYENPIVAKLFTKVNAFPVSRGLSDKNAIEYAVRVVKEGYVLGIFPEGTRSRNCKPARAKSGVAVIAKAAQADIVPVAVISTDNLKKHTKYTVRFGKPIKYEELGLNDESTRDDVRAAAAFVMDKIKALWEEGHCK